MFKFNKVESKGTASAIITDAERIRKTVYFDSETGIISGYAGSGTLQLMQEEVNILDVLRDNKPTPELTAAFGQLIGKEVSSLNFCSSECEFPWNIEPNAVRCGFCGAPLVGNVALDTIPGNSYSIGQKDWSIIERAFKAAVSGKIKPYIKNYAEESLYVIAFGWDNQFAFKNEGATTFRGKVNRTVLSEVGGTSVAIPMRRSFNGEHVSCLYPSEINAAFLRFVDDYGEMLVENPMQSVDPARENEMRNNYIHNAFINGVYYTQTGETMHPEKRFSALLYKAKPDFVNSEIAVESAWEVYCQALDAAEKSATIHKDGTISWRFMAAIDAITPDALRTFLIDRYGADADEVAFLLEPTEE